MVDTDGLEQTEKYYRLVFQVAQGPGLLAGNAAAIAAAAIHKCRQPCGGRQPVGPIAPEAHTPEPLMEENQRWFGRHANAANFKTANRGCNKRRQCGVANFGSLSAQ